MSVALSLKLKGGYEYVGITESERLLSIKLQSHLYECDGITERSERLLSIKLQSHLMSVSVLLILKSGYECVGITENEKLLWLSIKLQSHLYECVIA